MQDHNVSITKNTRVSNKAFGLSFIPIFGSQSIVQASRQVGDRTIMHLGWATLALSIVTALSGNFLIVLLLQICLATWLKFRPSKVLPLPPLHKVDVNHCSKNDLVHVLDLPIVYANDIDLIRKEGHLFTHLEELVNIAGLPEEQVRRIAPQVDFLYNTQIDSNHTWRQLNLLTASEMHSRGVELAVAQKIVEERTRKGDYRSAVDVKRRTGLAFRTYESLV